MCPRSLARPGLLAPFPLSIVQSMSQRAVAVLLLTLFVTARAELVAPNEVEHVATKVQSNTRASTLPMALNVHEVPADGDSLFNAVALAAALDNTDIRPLKKRDAMRERAPRLREQAVDLLCSAGPASLKALTIGGTAVAPLVEANQRKIGGGKAEPLSSYCARMRAPGEPGTLAELVALTKVLTRQIRLSTPDGPETYGESGAASKALSLLRGEDGYFGVISDVPNPDFASARAAESARAKVAAAKDRAQKKVDARRREVMPASKSKREL